MMPDEQVAASPCQKNHQPLCCGCAEQISRRTMVPTEEIMIRSLCMVDDQLGAVNKRSEANLYRSVSE
jgi:hypothetical protein